MRKKWRLIVDGFSKGSVNMARDEALLDSLLSPKGYFIPTLRLYKWYPWCISTGYFQDIRKEIELETAKNLGMDIVRRPTGGRAVLHTEELTYCLIIKQNYPGIPKGVVKSYKLLIQGIKLALEDLGLVPGLKELKSSRARAKAGGPSACFDYTSPYELLLKGKKVVGNAQMRRKNAILQHGAIKLKFDPETTAKVFKGGYSPGYLGDKAVGINDIEPQITEYELIKALIKGFEAAFDISVFEDDYSNHELKLAEDLYKYKYNRDEWNFNKNRLLT